MGKKKSQPVVGKRSRPQPQSQYIYHWERIVGAVLVVLVLVGLAAYGIHLLSSPEDLEHIEAADNVPTQTLNDETQLAANIEGRTEPEHVAAETVDSQAPPDSAETPPTREPGDGELSATAVEDVVRTTEIAVDNGEGFKRSTEPEEQEPAQSQHRVIDTPGVAETPPTPQPGDSELPAMAVEDVVLTTDIAVDDDEEFKQSTGPEEQGPSQSRHRDGETPRAVEEEKATFSLIDKKLSSPAVKRFELARSVQNRKPIGDIETITPDSRGVATVYAFSDIVGMREHHSIYYHWILNGQPVAKVRVGIGADRWRSHSSKIINESMKGRWRVELQDREGQVLASADFVY